MPIEIPDWDYTNPEQVPTEPPIPDPESEPTEDGE